MFITSKCFLKKLKADLQVFQAILLNRVCVSAAVPDFVRTGEKVPDQAVVDEEAILDLLESSQTFLPLSQTSNHSALLGAVTHTCSTAAAAYRLH